MSADRRKTVACSRCHKKKIRCPGGSTCLNCYQAGVHCTYPRRDRNITISESYLASLQAQAHSPSPLPLPQTPYTSALGVEANVEGEIPTPQRTATLTSGNHERNFVAPVLKDSTAEAFVSGLKKLSGHRADGPSPADGPPGNEGASVLVDDGDSISQYDYVPLNFDSSTSRVIIKLPPYPYALQLVNQFETYIGFEYHWYLLGPFHEGLESTYRQPDSTQSKDRVWLCKLLTVLALGESYNSCHAPAIEITDDRNQQPLPAAKMSSSTLPGAEFFEQALSLFKVPSEEPTVAHVEALNLIAFYCYSLNRRKTAYTYTGLAVRLASVLMLHKPIPSRSPAISEHYRRLWWTTFLMDTMTSAEVGLKASLRFTEAEQPMPSNASLKSEEQADFRDPDILAAYLRLCEARNIILETAGRLQQDDFTNFSHAVQHPLHLLEQWRLAMPPKFSFDFSYGLPSAMLNLPSMRSLASLYLRFHQGYILLIRPIFFKLLAITLGKDADESSLDTLIEFSNRCLEAAKCNMRILMGLSHADRLAKYGFWESLHLFSAINVFSLARLAQTLRPFSLYQTDSDLELYTSAKSILHSMAAHGNAASKGHVRLIEEIERLMDAVSLHSSNQDTDLTVSMTDLEQDIFQWIESIDNIDQYPV